MKMTSKEFLDLTKGINTHDLKTIFGSDLSTVIVANCDAEDIIDEIEKYIAYDVPVSVGDIIESDGDRFVVTCVYTDNSADICDDNGNRQNVGLYNVDYSIVGKLNRVEVNA